MSQMLSGVDREGIIKAVAIYLVVVGILSFCGGIALFGIGGMAGIFGAGTAAIVDESGLTAEERAAVTGLAGVGALAMIQGIISVVLGPVMLVVAYGLFQRKAWARQGVIIVAVVGAVLSLIGLGGGGLTSIVTLVIDAFIAYLFMTDEGIKTALSR